MTEKETDDIIEKTLDRVMPLALKAMSKRFREWRKSICKIFGHSWVTIYSWHANDPDDEHSMTYCIRCGKEKGE